MSNSIVYMVAVIYDGKNICGYRLYNVVSEKLVDVSKEKLIRLLKAGNTVCNIKLSNSGDRIESSSLNCSIKRYTSFNLDGSLKNKNVNKVLLNRYLGNQGVKSYLIFDSLLNRIDILDELRTKQLDSQYDYIANAVTLDSEDIINSNRDKFDECWKLSKTGYKKFKYSIDEMLGLSEFAIYAEGNEDQTFVVDNCMWIKNMHHTKIERLVFGHLVYGIGYRAISNIQVGSLEMNDIKIIESEFLRDSEIETLKIDGETWYSGANTIVNCKIDKIELGQDVIINNNFLVDCQVHELRFKGRTPSLNKHMRDMLANTKLDYIILDRDINNTEYEKISSLIGSEPKIIME